MRTEEVWCGPSTRTTCWYQATGRWISLWAPEVQPCLFLRWTPSWTFWQRFFLRPAGAVGRAEPLSTRCLRVRSHRHGGISLARSTWQRFATLLSQPETSAARAGGTHFGAPSGPRPIVTVAIRSSSRPLTGSRCVPAWSMARRSPAMPTASPCLSTSSANRLAAMCCGTPSTS